jgi:hypothetical protein
MQEHTDALARQFDAALAEVAAAADAARATIDSDIETLHGLAHAADRPPLIPDVPVEEPPPYVPPHAAPSANALIPDTPLVSEAPAAAAFDDDAPLWQS